MRITKSVARKEYLNLAEISGPHSVSVYMPTTETGTSAKDMITLKDLLKEARNQLASYELSDDEISDILEPAEPLLESSSPWRGLSNGMALFIHNGELRHYATDTLFGRQVHVSDMLYLLPMVNLVDRFKDFYVLRLSMNEVSLFACDQHDITAMDTGAVLPGNLQEVVGSDYEQKSLQYRSGQQAEGEGAFYHGHGSGDESEHKDEVTRYIRAVVDGLDQLIGQEDRPLIVACVDYLFPIYKSVNTYPHLVKKPLTGNYENQHPKALRADALQLLGDRWQSALEKDSARFRSSLHTKNASFMTDEIIKACYHGGVETLFVLKGQKLSGYYDPGKDDLKIKDDRGSEELLDFSAKHTIKNGGRVFLCEEDQMPEPSKMLNAIYRYAH